jgi:hypothetical protein
MDRRKTCRRHNVLGSTDYIATLTSGSWPKQGLAKVQAKKEAQKSHLMLLGVQESVKEWTFTLPSELAF